ncbi:hypothetical protein ACJX0J_038112, partial [Zea mays]
LAMFHDKCTILQTGKYMIYLLTSVNSKEIKLLCPGTWIYCTLHQYGNDITVTFCRVESYGQNLEKYIFLLLFLLSKEKLCFSHIVYGIKRQTSMEVTDHRLTKQVGNYYSTKVYTRAKSEQQSKIAARK